MIEYLMIEYPMIEYPIGQLPSFPRSRPQATGG